jgi:hypothetical protein
MWHEYTEVGSRISNIFFNKLKFHEFMYYKAHALVSVFNVFTPWLPCLSQNYVPALNTKSAGA